jgi:hypothetical protein
MSQTMPKLHINRPGPQAMQAGGVKEGSRVMVIGASGGTGTLGIQVAKAMGAGHVTAVTSQPNFDFVKSMRATGFDSAWVVLTKFWMQYPGHFLLLWVSKRPQTRSKLVEGLSCRMPNVP